MTQEDYDLCEKENNNLRSALAWAASKLTDADRDALEARLDDGDVTGTAAEDERHEMVLVLGKLVEHVEPLLETEPLLVIRRPYWSARLDHLLNEARGHGPKHPVLRRLGGHPNVFAPVRGAV